MNDDEQKIIVTHCNGCDRKTNHAVLYSHIDPWEQQHRGHTVWGCVTSELLKCKGCDEVCLLVTDSFSEWEYDNTVQYPPPVSRREPRWLNRIKDINIDVFDLMREVYQALHSNARRLALLGTRAALERILTEKCGDGPFEERVDKMVANDFLSPQAKVVIMSALDAGSAAMHRGFKPKKEMLGNVLDVVEHLIHEIYILPTISDEIREQTPPRSKKQ